MVGQVDIEVGTLSKAVGSMGGFVCCSAEFKSWLLNKGRAFVYSTALPVPNPSRLPSPVHLLIFSSHCHNSTHPFVTLKPTQAGPPCSRRHCMHQTLRPCGVLNPEIDAVNRRLPWQHL